MPGRGRRVVSWMHGIVRSVREAVADLAGDSSATGGPATTGQRPRVALLEWIDPIMGSGHWWGSSSSFWQFPFSCCCQRPFIGTRCWVLHGGSCERRASVEAAGLAGFLVWLCLGVFLFANLTGHTVCFAGNMLESKRTCRHSELAQAAVVQCIYSAIPATNSLPASSYVNQVATHCLHQ